jgi:hypothetical protein
MSASLARAATELILCVRNRFSCSAGGGVIGMFLRLHVHVQGRRPSDCGVLLMSVFSPMDAASACTRKKSPTQNALCCFLRRSPALPSFSVSAATVLLTATSSFSSARFSCCKCKISYWRRCAWRGKKAWQVECLVSGREDENTRRHRPPRFYWHLREVGERHGVCERKEEQHPR